MVPQGRPAGAVVAGRFAHDGDGGNGRRTPSAVCQYPRVRVLVAPDSYAGSLAAPAVADAIRAGWTVAAPGDDVRLCPLTDGGAGFLETLHATLDGRLLSATVRSPLGDPVPAAVLLVGEPSGATTAYVEAAHAVGPALVPSDRRDPARTTSAGLADLLRLARGTGARRVVVGVGAAATHDAGAGMLSALGVGPAGGALSSGGGALDAVTEAELAGLSALRAEWSGVHLVAAVADDLPLLGLHGASATHAAARGATPETAQHLERALGHFAHAAARALGPGDVRPDLLQPSRTGSSIARLTGLPGAGAGGGLGFGLALLGARVLPGAAVVADAVRLAARLSDVDLVVTGSASLDPHALHGTVTAVVAGHALAVGVPTVVIAGQVHVGRRELAAAGIAGAYAVAETADQVRAAHADPVGTLSARAARVARTWSR
jgi:glycerate 2-kinase